MTTEEKPASPAATLLTALGGSGIAVPPVGNLQLDKIQTFGPWSWGTRHVDEEEVLYMFRSSVVVDAIIKQGPFFAFCHSGHGINSYALNLVTRCGSVAVFVQHGWGGVYMDSLQSTFRINQTYARLHAFFDRIADPTAAVRWVLLYSRSRGVSGIVDVATYQLTGSLSDAFIPIDDDEGQAGQGEARIFAFLAEQPDLLKSPFSQEPDWGFPPKPIENPAIQGQPAKVHELQKHERDNPPDRAVPSARTEYLAWLYASRYLPSWPDLLLTWMDRHDSVPHLVLH